MSTNSPAVSRRPATSPDVPPANGRVTPPLKWAGGKRWQLPHVADIWSAHRDRRLVEPFCGGLAIALGLRPDRALLNDVNPHLINFYRWLKRGLSPTVAMANDGELYYAHRERFNACVRAGNADTAEAASLFYYLNRTAYNGLCRFNRKGEFNVPFGRYVRIRYRADFSEYRPAFARWTFTADDFESLALDAGDFLYADPPYDVDFTTYAAGGFSWDDQVRTAEWVARHDGPSVLVNQATDRIVQLYRRLGFRLTRLDGPRRISCSGDRAPAREVLATRNV